MLVDAKLVHARRQRFDRVVDAPVHPTGRDFVIACDLPDAALRRIHFEVVEKLKELHRRAQPFGRGWAAVLLKAIREHARRHARYRREHRIGVEGLEELRQRDCLPSTKRALALALT